MSVAVGDVPQPFRLMRHRPFVMFWLARGSNTLAYQILGVALGWQVYDLTRQPLDLGLIGLCQFGPTALLTLPAGHVADRYPQRLVIRLCMAGFAAIAAILALATMTGRLSLPLFYTLAACLGAIRAFEGPSGSVLLVGLVPRSEFGRAIAADSSIRQTAIIAGPGLGGLLYGGGAGLAYAVCSAVYVAALLLLAGLPFVATAPAREKTTLATLFAGLGFIRAEKAVLGAMWLDLLALLLGSTTAVLPVYARDILHAGPVALGLLRGASAVGAVTVAAVLARHPLRRHGGPLMIAAVAVYAIMICAFAVSHTILVSALALMLMGASDQLSVCVRNTLVQLRTPDAMRGRVSAVSNVFIMTSVNLGDFRAGLMASVLGPVTGVFIGGVSTLVLAGLCSSLFPALRRVDFLEDRR